jgi:hypothetical protein
MIRRAFSLIVLLFCVNAMLATISCKRKDKTPSYCRVVSTTSLNGYRESNSVLSNNDNEVVATTLRLQLIVNSKAQVCKNTQTDRGFSFFNKAYAYIGSSSAGYPRLDSIVSFDIVSDKAYDDAHPAGTSLKGSIFTTDDEYMLRSLTGDYTQFFFYCDQAPTETGVHTFTVNLVKNNGEVIKVSSIPIKMLK